MALSFDYWRGGQVLYGSPGNFADYWRQGQVAVVFTSSSGTNVTVLADVISGTLALPSPSFSLDSTTFPGTLLLVADLPSPTVSTDTSVTVVADTLSGTLSLLDPTINYDYIVIIPGALVGNLNLPTPTVIIPVATTATTSKIYLYLGIGI